MATTKRGDQLTWDEVLYIGAVDHPKAYVVPARQYERLIRAAEKLRRLRREMRAAKAANAAPPKVAKATSRARTRARQA